jgi:hypothetical protein
VITRGGTVICWGHNDNDESTVPPSLDTAATIKCGGNHIAVLTFEGRVVCWGNNAQSQCSVPVHLVNVVDISCGAAFTAAIIQTGEVICWGYNENHQCDVPAELEHATALSCGGAHAAALTVDGRVVCWGRNDHGQCTVPPTLARVVRISCGYYHTVALTEEGTVVCWGRNNEGQCNVPEDLGIVTMVSCGFYFSAALTQNGLVKCWGDNYYQQCNVPAGLVRVRDLCCGNFHIAALTETGNLRCWGNNSQGQCNVPSNLQVMLLPRLAQLADQNYLRGQVANGRRQTQALTAQLEEERVRAAIAAAELERLRVQVANGQTETQALTAKLEEERAVRRAAEARLNRALYGHFDAGASFSRSLAHLLQCCDNVYDCSVEEAVFGLHSNPGVSCLQPHLCSVDCDEKYIRATVQEVRRELEDFLLKDQLLVNNPTLSLDHLLAIKLYTFGNDRLKFFAAINTPFYDPNRTLESLKGQLPFVRLLIRSLRALGSCTQFERVVVFRGARIQDSPYLQQVRTDYINKTTNSDLMEGTLLRFPSFTSTSKKESKAVAGFGSDFVYVITLNHNVSMFLMHVGVGCDRKLILSLL